VGEQWLDTTGGTYVFKVWDGSAWRSESGTFVDASGDTMTGALVMDNQQQVRFRETTANGTNYIALQAPASVASDKTITLPDQNGSVLVSGNASIVNADVNASAAIAGTKIAPDFGSQTIQTTGIVSHALGTALAPTVTFTGDTNTGLYSPGADQLALATGGTGRLFVDASGNVGVGYASPSNFAGGDLGATAPLVVGDGTGSRNVNIFSANNNYGHLAFSDGTSGSSTYAGLIQYYHVTDSMAFYTGSSLRMLIDSSGRLGLGTSSADNKLSVGIASADEGIELKATYNGARVARFALLNPGVDNTPYIGSVTGNDFGFITSGTRRMTLTAGGSLGIGSTAPQHLCQIAGTLAVDSYNDTSKTITLRPGFEANANGGMGLQAKDHSGAAPDGLGIYGTDGVSIMTANAGTFFERCRWDTSGRFLVGTSSSAAAYGGGVNTLFQVAGGTGNSSAYPGISCFAYSTSDSWGTVSIAKSNSNTAGTQAAVAANHRLGELTFEGSNGTSFKIGASIYAENDQASAWGATDCPSRLVFSTTADGASSPTERMRINNGGDVLIAQSSTNAPGVGNTTSGIAFQASGLACLSQSGATVLYVNRSTSDGTIVSLRQDGTEEGTISVSGTTVSYNGAHLSRWSQLPGGAERTEILRGTILSNIDEMCEWPNEENEQLNRMKVSDVEGDPNVSGVFQGWDDDDDTYTDDFYCAMTGDFIIRIAEGVTVQRGDLLMSAGNGTAKPQGDDIVRSKTIAKATSTHVTCTYNDGSYCLPCVLMAC
jgi:hypothetical protein